MDYIFANFPDALLIAEMESGIVIDVNCEALNLFGHSREEIIGKDINDLFKVMDEDSAKNIFVFNELAESGVIRKFDNSIVRNNGEIIPVETSTRILLFEEKLCQIISVRNVKQRILYEKKINVAREKAEELDNLKSNFLMNMSHELRTPLVSILGYSQYLMEEITDEDLNPMVTSINKSGKRLLDTLSLLLDLSLIAQKKMAFRKSIINPVHVINEVIERIKYKLEPKNLFLKTDYVADNKFLKVDGRMLIQVIKGLIDNAIKYTDNGGITITVKEDFQENNPNILISIKDTGIGINREKIDMIFEEFRQVSEGSTRQYQGTGLGLTISKKFVEYNGGKLWVESHPGKGSEFVISFPSFLIENQRELTEELFVEDSIKNIKNKVLLFEGDTATTEIIQRILEENCDVVTVHTAEEMLLKVKNELFDIFIFDINLANYYEVIFVLEEVKKINFLGNKIAILPDYERLEEEQLAKRGLSFVYYKPLSKESFKDFVSLFLK